VSDLGFPPHEEVPPVESPRRGWTAALLRWEALLVVLLGGCASLTSRGPGLAVPTREVLPNGVVVISQEHRASDVVAVQLWLRVGGRD